jgi:hypothetical protein
MSVRVHLQKQQPAHQKAENLHALSDSCNSDEQRILYNKNVRTNVPTRSLSPIVSVDVIMSSILFRDVIDKTCSNTLKADGFSTKAELQKLRDQECYVLRSTKEPGLLKDPEY